MSRPIVPIAVAMILGIVSAKAADFDAGPAMLTAGVMAVAAGIITFSMSPRVIRRTAFLSVWLMLPGVTWLGYARTLEADIQTPLKTVLKRSTDASVTGTIDYISLRQDGYAITVTASTAQIGQISYKANKLIISVDYPTEGDYCIGDIICAEGKLYPCEPATNPGQFDAERYYGVRKVDGRLYADYVQAESKNKSLKYRVKNRVYQVRRRLSEGIYRVLPAREAGTLNAILTGDRGMLDEDVKALYSEGGIAHILSISSLHITLLGMGLFRFLMLTVQRLKLSVTATFAVMLLYGVLTGFSVSACRAIIMLAVSLMGKLLHRGYDLPSAVGTAAVILLAVQPNYLYDTGFRLSFVAVIGIYAATRLSDALEIKNDILKSLLMSAWIQVFTLPEVMSSYFEISPYSLLANLIVLPLMSVLLVAGPISGAIGCTRFVYPGRIAAGPVYYILRLYEKICDLEGALPFGRVITGAPDKIMTAIYYAAVTIGLTACIKGLERKDNGKKSNFGNKDAQKSQSRKNKGAALLWLLPVMLGMAGLFIHPDSPDLYCAFLDVGQGDSIYIEAAGKHIMVDSGSTSVKNVGRYRVIPFLKYSAVKRLDMVVISHTDTDHTCAVIEMIEEGYPKIAEIVIGYNVADDSRIAEAALSAGIPLKRASAGESLVEEIAVKGHREKNRNGVLEINAVSPAKGVEYEDENSASLVLEVMLGDFSMLLTGDSDFAAEVRYCTGLKRGSYSVLKCAHHGSKYSTSLEMLNSVKPVVTVISCSKYNTYGHPNPNLLDRLKIADSKIFTTPECGMISVSYRLGEDVRIEKYTD